MTKAHLNLLREHYERETGFTKAALGYRDIVANHYNLLIPANASVLAVGGGTGELLGLLKRSSR